MALEEALGYSVADEELQNMKTVGDIVRYLEDPPGLSHGTCRRFSAAGPL